MKIKRLAILVVLLAACRRDRPPPRTGCAATFAGKVGESAASSERCATLAGTVLSLSIPSAALDQPLAVEIDLGAVPAIGSYTSVTVPRWSARGASGNKACLFAAGTGLARRGSFTLDVTAIDPVAGTLTLSLPVLQTPFQNCGAALAQTVTVVF